MTLTCQTDSSNPRSTVTWYRNGQQIGLTSQSSYKAGLYGGEITTHPLDFVPTREMDGQIIECRAANQLSGNDVAISSIQLDLLCKFSIDVYIVFDIYIYIYILYFTRVC